MVRTLTKMQNKIYRAESISENFRCIPLSEQGGKLHCCYQCNHINALICDFLKGKSTQSEYEKCSGFEFNFSPLNECEPPGLFNQTIDLCSNNKQNCQFKNCAFEYDENNDDNLNLICTNSSDPYENQDIFSETLQQKKKGMNSTNKNSSGIHTFVPSCIAKTNGSGIVNIKLYGNSEYIRHDQGSASYDFWDIGIIVISVLIILWVIMKALMSLHKFLTVKKFETSMRYSQLRNSEIE